MRLRSALAVVPVLLLLGCGDGELPPPAAACTSAPEAIERALAAAPGAVLLADGSTLADCVERATTDAELQSVGLVFSRAAESLRSRIRREPEEAGVRLGYLVGATRRGGRTTNGVLAELVRRIESTAGRALEDGGPAGLRAFRAGERAGERHG